MSYPSCKSMHDVSFAGERDCSGPLPQRWPEATPARSRTLPASPVPCSCCGSLACKGLCQPVRAPPSVRRAVSRSGRCPRPRPLELLLLAPHHPSLQLLKMEKFSLFGWITPAAVRLTAAGRPQSSVELGPHPGLRPFREAEVGPRTGRRSVRVAGTGTRARIRRHPPRLDDLEHAAGPALPKARAQALSLFRRCHIPAQCPAVATCLSETRRSVPSSMGRNNRPPRRPGYVRHRRSIAADCDAVTAWVTRAVVSCRSKLGLEACAVGDQLTDPLG